VGVAILKEMKICKSIMSQSVGRRLGGNEVLSLKARYGLPSVSRPFASQEDGRLRPCEGLAKWPRSLSIVVCVLLWSVTMYGQEPVAWATVTGQVFDFEGQPLANTRISIFPMDTGMSGRGPPSPMTDHEGRYSVSLPPYQGRTRFCAVKERAGYPDTQDVVFGSGNDDRPIVNLVPGGRFENVDIHLGSPDGILEGTVVDADTGKPLWQARITLRRADVAAGMYSTSLPPDGRFLFALPPAPIEITVAAPLYEPWSYTDPQTGANSMLLQSDEHRKLTVRLLVKR
jgi:hypothetical protein